MTLPIGSYRIPTEIIRVVVSYSDANPLELARVSRIFRAGVFFNRPNLLHAYKAQRVEAKCLWMKLEDSQGIPLGMCALQRNIIRTQRVRNDPTGALSRAVNENNKEDVIYFCTHEQNSLAQISLQTMLSLMNRACLQGNIDVLRALLEMVFVLFVEVSEPKKVLSLSLSGGYLFIAKELLKFSRLFFSFNQNFGDVVQQAALLGYAEIVHTCFHSPYAFVVSTDSLLQAFDNAVMRGYGAVVKELLDARPAQAFPQEVLRRSLKTAVLNGHDLIVQSLLDHEVLPDDEMLTVAMKRCYITIVSKFLACRQPDLFSLECLQWVLMSVMKRGSLSIMERLLAPPYISLFPVLFLRQVRQEAVSREYVSIDCLLQRHLLERDSSRCCVIS